MTKQNVIDLIEKRTDSTLTEQEQTLVGIAFNLGRVEGYEEGMRSAYTAIEAVYGTKKGTVTPYRLEDFGKVAR